MPEAGMLVPTPGRVDQVIPPEQTAEIVEKEQLILLLMAAIGLGRIRGLDEYIRPYRNGRDLAERDCGVLVIDLHGLTEQQVKDRFPEVFQWVAERVKPERELNNERYRRENWWPTPVVVATTPVVMIPTPVVVATTPVVVIPTPVVMATTPVVTIPTPVVMAATPVVVIPTPVVMATTPVVMIPTPVVMAATPVVAAATPVLMRPLAGGES